jgi:hypothetical protein
MSRLSRGNPTLGELSASIYSSFVARARASGKQFCPLHEGDTYMVPPVGARLFDGATYDVPGIHKYSPIRGRPELIDAILTQRETKDGHACRRRMCCTACKLSRAGSDADEINDFLCLRALEAAFFVPIHWPDARIPLSVRVSTSRQSRLEALRLFPALVLLNRRRTN